MNLQKKYESLSGNIVYDKIAIVDSSGRYVGKYTPAMAKNFIELYGDKPKTKKMFNVSVEKRMYCTGTVQAKACSPEDALVLVKHGMDTGKIQTTDVSWNEPQYEDSSFDTTGDIEED